MSNNSIQDSGDSNDTRIDVEKYFRPSNEPVLNTGDYNALFSNYIQSGDSIIIPRDVHPIMAGLMMQRMLSRSNIVAGVLWSKRYYQQCKRIMSNIFVLREQMDITIV